jgi:CBS domain containing-hemolysin-like protein
VAVARPEGVSLALAPLTQALAIVFLPLAGLVASRFPAPRPGGAARGANGDAGPSELQKFVDVVDENSALEAGEQKMIHGIVELGERTVREVMVPRIDMIAVSRDARVSDVLERIHASGHSRIPVYGDGIDDIVGILYAKDLLHRMGAVTLDAPIEPLIRPAHFVPETKRVDDLLHEMQDMKVHIAIVVDEYGGTAGLITIEDLLDEIVGEIRDEYDILEETWIEPINEREAIFNARVSIHDVNQTLPLDLDDAEYDTLGGLVYASLGKVPAQGDEVRVDNAVVTVLSTAGRRIRKVRVTVEPPPPNGKEG